MKRLLFAFSILAALSSCLKGNDTNTCTATDSPTVAPAAEVNFLQSWCATNAPGAIQHSSGLYYEIITPGTGASAVICSRVTVRYSGYLLGSSTAFDASTAPVNFPLYGLVLGWQKGIPLIKPGGSIRLYIPPTLGYGAAGSPPTIPANAYLKFDIQLDAVE
jgi:FKBP-type peptidyl-prolyl cis-trans isomerase FkpA